VSAFSGLSSDERGNSKSDAALSHLRGLITKSRGKGDLKGKRGIDLDAPRAVPLPDEQRATAVLQQLMEEEDRREAERKRMAEAEAEWRLHEDRRLADAREQWEAEAQQRIAVALQQASRDEQQRLAAAEAKLKDRLAEQLVLAEARLKTKLARGRAGGGKDVAAVDVDAIEAAVTSRLQAEFADEISATEARWKTAEANAAAAKAAWKPKRLAAGGPRRFAGGIAGQDRRTVGRRRDALESGGSRTAGREARAGARGRREGRRAGQADLESKIAEAQARWQARGSGGRRRRGALAPAG
jgi:hypothetical protein